MFRSLPTHGAAFLLCACAVDMPAVPMRNFVDDCMDELKRMEKDGDLSEDDHKVYAEEVQTMTDKTIREIDDIFSNKQAEITQV